MLYVCVTLCVYEKDVPLLFYAAECVNDINYHEWQELALKGKISLILDYMYLKNQSFNKSEFRLSFKNFTA